MKQIDKVAYLSHSMSAAYQRRIERAQQTIAEALGVSQSPYIAFSTGKDSVVMADLIWRQSPKIPAVYFDAAAVFPESKDLLERYGEHKNIIIFETEPILDTMERMGGPTSPACEMETMRSTVYRPIKALLERYSFDGSFVGLRSEESGGRHLNLRVRGPIHFSKQHGVHVFWPIGHLTFEDVWAYILSNSIDYCAAYDKQFEMGLPLEDCRLSYWAGETKHRWGRWAILRRGWPELFNEFAYRFPEVRRFT
jgi:3'-phosphoadenosine 5'-phosphosulfate sulfotransferase (PAPS reductase)/FAD synthetase